MDWHDTRRARFVRIQKARAESGGSSSLSSSSLEMTTALIPASEKRKQLNDMTPTRLAIEKFISMKISGAKKFPVTWNVEILEYRIFFSNFVHWESVRVWLKEKGYAIQVEETTEMRQDYSDNEFYPVSVTWVTIDFATE
jgi:hypothetical protein